jgi:hypothetical protein
MVFQQLQHVKPQASEGLYTPLKDRVEELIKAKIGSWADDAAQGKKQEFTAEIPAYLPMPKEVLQRPPALTDASLQSALPGSRVPQGPHSGGLGLTEDRTRPAEN